MALKRIDRTIAGLEAERAQAGHKPTLDLVVGYGLEHRQITYTEPRTASTMFGVQFNLSLYEGGSISSKARETAALLAKQAYLG